MDPRALRYFVLVAEEGSVHAGARRAMVAQPALSVALKKLEREVGAALLERSHKGVTLTEAGVALLPRARQILDSIETAKNVASLATPSAGTAPVFTVGLVEGRVAAGELTGPILAGFQHANPHLRVSVRQLNFLEQFNCVLDGSVEVAIVRSPYEHSKLAMAPLFDEPTLLIASPGHRLADLPELTVDSVLDEPMLEVTRTPQPWRKFWNFADLRHSARSIPSPALGLLDITLDILRNCAISPMAQSGWRLGGLGDSALRAVRLVDGPYSVAGVGYRRDDHRAEVASFIQTARTVVSGCVSVIPEGKLAVRQGDN